MTGRLRARRGARLAAFPPASRIAPPPNWPNWLIALVFAPCGVRGTPLYDPSFGDAVWCSRCSPFLGYLAGITQNILLGTAAVVLPIREPLLTLSSPSPYSA